LAAQQTVSILRSYEINVENWTVIGIVTSFLDTPPKGECDSTELEKRCSSVRQERCFLLTQKRVRFLFEESCSRVRCANRSGRICFG